MEEWREGGANIGSMPVYLTTPYTTAPYNSKINLNAVVGKHGALAFRQPFDEGEEQEQGSGERRVARPLRRRMAMAAYQCTAAMVIRTQSDPKVIGGLLGPEKTRGAAFLQHIVDRSRSHFFAPWEVCVRKRWWRIDGWMDG